MKKKIFIIFPILIGLIFYWLYRPANLLINTSTKPEFINKKCVRDTLTEIKSLNILPEIIEGSLPSAIWSFLLFSFLIVIWKGKINNENWIYYLMVIIFPIGYEYGQKLALLSGTFDTSDIYFAMSGIVCSIIIYKPKIQFI